MSRLLRIPLLTRRRIIFAISVAAVADAVQFFLGPPGWVVFDQVIDMIAMVLVAWAIGFHPLLLPTFIVEFIPLVDMLPTWTACVAAVIVLRKRAQRSTAPIPPQIPED